MTLLEYLKGDLISNEDFFDHLREISLMNPSLGPVMLGTLLLLAFVTCSLYHFHFIFEGKQIDLPFYCCCFNVCVCVA